MPAEETPVSAQTDEIRLGISAAEELFRHQAGFLVAVEQEEGLRAGVQRVGVDGGGLEQGQGPLPVAACGGGISHARLEPPSQQMGLGDLGALPGGALRRLEPAQHLKRRRGRPVRLAGVEDASLLADMDGLLRTHFVAVVSDITDKKRQEEASHDFAGVPPDVIEDAQIISEEED